MNYLKFLFVTLLCILTVSFSEPVSAAPLDDFVITVQSDNAGPSADDEFTIPTNGSSDNYNVDCDNDGIDEVTAQSGDYTCNFSTSSSGIGAGTYTIRIKDNSLLNIGFGDIYFNNGGDKEKILTVEQWGTTQWSTMSSAFFGATNLVVNATDIPDLSNVGQLDSMFRNATSANPDVSGWDTSNVSSAGRMFAGATSADPNVSNWDTSGIVSMLSMFEGATSADPDVSTWDTSSATTFQNMFNGATSADPDVSGWDVSNVISLNSMFEGATSADPDVSGWDVSNISRMSSLFLNATSANPDVSNWDTSSLVFVNNMFNNATSADPDVSGWDVSNVTNLSALFAGATSADPNVSNWDVSNVTIMNGIFAGATSANPDVSGWDTGNLVSATIMFRNATSANPDVSNWDTGNLQNVFRIFDGATLANPDVSGWDVSNLSTATNMLADSAFSLENYDNLLTNWGAQVLQNNVSFSVGDTQYCVADAARTSIIATYNWSITDNGRDCDPIVSITAPTKLAGGSITDTTITVTDYIGINVAGVTVDPLTTATVSALSCVQTTALQVDCTISIDTSGSLSINATNTSANTLVETEINYVVDTVGPALNLSISTLGGINTPTLTFSATDNVAVDYYEVTYTSDDGVGGTVGTLVTDSPVTSPVALNLDPDFVLPHSVTVRVYDTVGNVTDSTILFPPIITFITPTQISNATITDATFTVTNPSGNDITNISLIPNTTGATLGTCTGNGGSLVQPYQEPVVCQINTITATGTITINAEDDVNGARGQNNQSYIIDTVNPVINIIAPTKSDNAAITDTTLVITDDTAINAADIVVTTVNAAGAFTVSNLSCTQITPTQVDCTLQVDAGTGAGDIQVDVTDVAGNTSQNIEAGYEVDVDPPAVPAAAPDLQSGSDTGISNTDNVTSDTTPDFDVVCTEIGSTITIYLDGNAENSYICTAVATETASLTFPLANGTYNVTYTETDTFDNESNQSPGLSMTIDTVAPGTVATLSSPSSLSSNLSSSLIGSCGASTANGTVSITTNPVNFAPYPPTATLDGSGNFNITGLTWVEGTYDINIACTDQAGNGPFATALNSYLLDATPPIDPTIDNVLSNDTTITGTGEDSTIITLDSGVCINNPVIVAGGIWSCDLSLLDAPVAGDTITATSTDTVGNTSTANYTIPLPTTSSRGGGGGGGSARRSEQEVDALLNSVTTAPTESNPFGGTQCQSNLIVSNNMRQGDRNGNYSAYNQGIVTQINILQGHMNRLLLDEFGNQASGPIDGIFGPLTKRGVERLQTRLNQLLPTMTPLVIDGIVGPFTKAAINMSCN